VPKRISQEKHAIKKRRNPFGQAPGAGKVLPGWATPENIRGEARKARMQGGGGEKKTLNPEKAPADVLIEDPEAGVKRKRRVSPGEGASKKSLVKEPKSRMNTKPPQKPSSSPNKK